MSYFDNSSSSGSAKARIIAQIQEEAALSNAKSLIAKVNENCFASCIPNPGTSLSSGEQNCLSQCMEKYIEAWNVTSKTYTSRLGQDLQKANGGKLL